MSSEVKVAVMPWHMTAARLFPLVHSPSVWTLSSLIAEVMLTARAIRTANAMIEELSFFLTFRVFQARDMARLQKGRGEPGTCGGTAEIDEFYIYIYKE